MSIKTRGTHFEYRVRDWLVGKGWTLFRSAGSQTCADLIALKSHKQILAVQCKASQKPSLSDDEWEGLIDLTKIGARSLVICRDSNNHSLQVYEIVLLKDAEEDEEGEYGLQMTFEFTS